MTTPLTDAALAALLAPVPVPAQQREVPVVINLRPGLPPDYAGPVELADLRLQASPWHWLRAQFAHTARSQALAAELATARACGRPDLTDVENVAEWLAEQVEVAGNYSFINPSDNSYWGVYGILDCDLDGRAHFLPPALRTNDVVALFDDGVGEFEGTIVLEVSWQTDEGPTYGPLALLGNPLAVPGDGQPEWTTAASYLVLADPSTGAHILLTDGQLTEEEDESADDPTTWRGQVPRYDEGTFLTTDLGTAPAWLSGGLRYAAGRLYHSDSEQALTVNVFSRQPKPTN